MDRRTFISLRRALRVRPSQVESKSFERSLQVVQLLATVATLGFLAVGFVRFDSTLKTFDVQQKQFESEHRIDAESRLQIQKIRSVAPDNLYEASFSYTVKNISTQPLYVPVIVIETFRGTVSDGLAAALGGLVRLNRPREESSFPIVWKKVGCEKFIDNEDWRSRVPECPNVQFEGGTGGLKIREAASWEQTYRFTGAKKDAVGFRARIYLTGIESRDLDEQAAWKFEEFDLVDSVADAPTKAR